MRVVALDESLLPWVAGLLTEHFDSPRIVSRGRLYDATALPGLVAVVDGRPLGVACYQVEGRSCELVFLVAAEQRRGIGRALVEALSTLAVGAGCRRLWLVTTNDNAEAQAFYSAVGFSCVAVHRGAIARSRLLKPELPAFGVGGVPIEDEIEFERELSLASTGRAPVDSRSRLTKGTKMRGVLCYYSGSGNTKLVCEYLAARVGTEFDLVDVIRDGTIDVAAYDVVGLATSTDFWGIPECFETFLGGLPIQQGTPAFVINTFGLASGRTLCDMAALAETRGLKVLAGHSVRMPESYPPMIAAGMGFTGQPSRKVMSGLDKFVGELVLTLRALQRGDPVEPRRVRIGLLGAVSPRRPRTTARADMGDKFVDAQLCTECGTCGRGCPYGAITLSPTPAFDMSRCRGCWRCFSQCPQHAIYTAKFRGGPYYAGPSEHAKKALRRQG